MTLFWHGVLTIQGFESPDHRILSNVTWRDLPLTLRIQTEDFGQHDGASPVGSITLMETSTQEAMAALGFTVPPSSAPVYAQGTFSDSEAGQLAAQWMGEKVLRGVSVDPGAVEYTEEIIDPATGAVVDMSQIMEAWDQIDAAEILGNDDEAARLYEWLESLYYRVNFTAYEVAAATLVATPAFGECILELWSGPGAQGEQSTSREPQAQLASRREDLRSKFGLGPAPETVEQPALTVRQRLSALLRTDGADQVAGFSPARMIAAGGATRFESIQAAAPAAMHADWFQPIQTDGVVKFTISDEGRMMGHLFTWDSCHRSFAAAGRCLAPTFLRDDPNFADFHVGEARLDNGQRLRVGTLTFAANHADDLPKATPAELIDLMENTGTQLGPVRLYVDKFGLQASGQLFDDVSATEAARALAGFPSYDARRIGGRLRLYGLHVVNTPGHPIYEEADGQVVRMVASVAPAVGPHTAAALLAAGSSCGCGGVHAAATGSQPGTEASGTCTCQPKLTASALADLAALDAAVKHRAPAKV